jgi:hypothetical protein
LQLKLDVKTRWNSTFDMLDRVLKLKPAYDSMCNGDGGLNKYKITTDEWNYLEQLKKLLHRFNTLTTKVSASTAYPTISKTIAVYNKLIDHIEIFIENNTNNNDVLSEQLKLGATAANEKLKKYYSKTDFSPVYSVATAMDSRMKFYWWDRKNWEEEYQEQSQAMVRKIWADNYRVTPEVADIPMVFDLDDDDDDFCTGPSNVDELERYVTEPPNESLPLDFWNRHCTTWPCLAKMAQDYLSIPATSTPSERCFSQARLLLPYTRNRISKENIKRLMLLETWLKKMK